jgi:hypothetical protein
MKVTKDSVPQVLEAIAHLVGQEVLVGIPDSSTSRHDDEGQPITNAALGYIHEMGAPAAGIPARPFLVPGVKKARPGVVAILRRAATAALAGNYQEADKALDQAGVVASTSAQREIQAGIPPPLKPASVRGRKYARQTKSRRESESLYLALVKYGADPAAAERGSGVRPLMNTLQLLKSITWVVRRVRNYHAMRAARVLR